MREREPALNLSLEQLNSEASSALNQLRAVDHGLLPLVDEYLDAHGRWPSGWAYGRVPHEVQSVLALVHERSGEEAVPPFHRAALCLALQQTHADLQAHDRWAHSIQCFEDAAARILRGLLTRESDTLRYPSDHFAKDMALATGRVWHARAQLVEPRMGIERGRLLRSGVGSAVEAIRLLLGLGGHFPFYEIHTYHNLLHWFTEPDWTECYRMIATALRLDLEAKGVFGTAWFFDPKIAEISPRLSYLRRFPEERGGQFIKVQTSPSGIESAIATSDTRRRLYEAGEYVPEEYLLVWPRDSLIAWLEGQS